MLYHAPHIYERAFDGSRTFSGTKGILGKIFLLGKSYFAGVEKHPRHKETPLESGASCCFIRPTAGYFSSGR